jgi:hypothetical protein
LQTLGAMQPYWLGTPPTVPTQQAFKFRLQSLVPRQSIVGAMQDPLPSQYNVVFDF